MRTWLAVVWPLLGAACAAAQFPQPENLPGIAGYCGFEETDLAHLRDSGLVVVTHSPQTNLYNCYYGLEMAGLPVYVTSDAMLYLWYEAHREALMAAERQFLRPQLIEFVRGMFEQTQILRAEGDDTLLAEASFRRENAVMLAVVRKLLEPAWEPPEELAGEVGTEVERVMEHTLVQVYPGEDYTQYEVRGYYTEDEELSTYFRGAKYLARRYFRVADPRAPADAARELRRAALLVLAMREGPGLAELYRDLYDLRAFLCGPADTIRLDQLLAACGLVWGAEWSREDIAGVSALQRELCTDRYPTTRIHTRYAPGFPTLPLPPWNVAVLGEHYLPDSELFHQTTEPAVPLRHLPTGLDVATALGSEAAAEKLAAVAAEFPQVVPAAREFGPRMTGDSIYGEWLDTLRALFDRPEGLPAFARAPAYEGKQINCCLTSWAQLRHNYILYGAQAYSCLGGSIGRGGLVEPLPDFFARYAQMCQALAQRVKQHGIEGRVVDVIARLDAKAETFERCAADQLAGRDTAWAYRDLHGFGTWIQTVFFDSPLVVADVCTSSETRSVLHAASGPFHPIVVMDEESDRWLAAVGYVGSYYEFVEPEMGRVTDEEWKARVEAAYARPEPPEWLVELYAPVPPASAELRRRLRELETMLRKGAEEEAVAAIEDFMAQHRDTEWEPAAALVLGKHLLDTEQYERAAEALPDLDRMYGCDARDEAKVALRRAQGQVERAAREAEEKRRLEEALAPTAPREGLSPEQDLERQNQRAEILLEYSAEALHFFPERASGKLERLVQECPDSGYAAFAELALVFAGWGRAQYAGIETREQRAAELLPDCEALARKHEGSIIGHAARVVAASLHYLAGDLRLAYEQVQPLVGVEPPEPEPYPLSAACLERADWDEGPWGEPTVDASRLMDAVLEDLLQEAFAEGDVRLARELAEGWPDDASSHSYADFVRTALDYFADEIDALGEFAPLLALQYATVSPPDLAELVTSTQRIAAAHPGTKVGRATLFWACEAALWFPDDAAVQQSAERARAELARQYPDSVDNLVVQVLHLTRQGQYDEAVPFWRRLTAQHPPERLRDDLPFYMEDFAYDLSDPAERKASHEKYIAGLEGKYGEFVAEAGLPEDYLQADVHEGELVKELLRRLPDRQLDIVEVRGRMYDLGDLGRSILAAHPEDPRALELHWQLGQPQDLLTIIAAGTEAAHFGEAVERFGTSYPPERATLREALAFCRQAADRHRGMPAEALALAAAGNTYLAHDRPEQAIEFLQTALERVPEGRMFRERMVVALARARRQVAAKRRARAEKVWEVPISGGEPATKAELPTLRSGRLYVQGRSQRGGEALVCLDAASGAELWRAPVAPLSSVVLRDRALFVATTRGTVHCLDPAAGETRWTRELGPGRAGAAWCDATERTVVAYWKQGLLCALDADTGQTLWEHDSLLAEAAPTVSASLVYNWQEGGTLQARRLSDGGRAWTWDFRSCLPEHVRGRFRHPSFPAPLVSGDDLIALIGGDGCLVAALRPESGDLVWSKYWGGSSRSLYRLAGPDRRLLVAVGDDARCLSCIDGAALWSLAARHGSMRGLAAVDDVLLLGTHEECLAVDWTLGGVVGRFSAVAASGGIAAERTGDALRVYAAGRDQVAAWDLRIPDLY